MSIARASMSVLPGARARRATSLVCAPVTPLFCGLLCCALYDVSCSVGLLHKTYAVASTQPISFPANCGLATVPNEMLSHVVRRNANVCGTKWLRRAAAPQSPIQTAMALQTLLYHTPN